MVVAGSEHGVFSRSVKWVSEKFSTGSGSTAHHTTLCSLVLGHVSFFWESNKTFLVRGCSGIGGGIGIPPFGGGIGIPPFGGGIGIPPFRSFPISSSLVFGAPECSTPFGPIKWGKPRTCFGALVWGMSWIRP